MILRLFDGSEQYITADQAENIEQAIANGIQLIKVNHPSGDPNKALRFSSKAVAYIKPGGQPPTDPSRTLAAKSEAGDPPEKTAANRKKIREFLASRKTLAEHKGLS